MEYPNLGQRTRTAVFLTVAFLSLLLFARATCGGRIALTAASFAVAAIAAWELASVCAASSGSRARLAYFLALVAPATFCFYLLGAQGVCDTIFNPARGVRAVMIAWGSAFMLSTLSLVAFGQRGLDKAAQSAQDLLPAAAMCGFAAVGLMALTAMPRAPTILVWLVTVVAVNDMAAYFGGVKIGGPKMSPFISPNKTISGSLCGLLAGTVAGLLLSGFLSGQISWIESAALSLCVVAAAQLGDLTKSFLKRQHGVKDMGKILPGHGGLVDRIDGVLLASPLLYSWLVYREILL